MTKPTDPVVRFWAGVTKTEGCWIRGGCRDAFGYARISIMRRYVPAHRFSWELAYGLIPKGLCVLHRCDNPPCVRPDHLFLGTKLDNMADMIAKGRARNPHAEAMRAKTHCDNGHPFDETNTARDSRGKRYCKTCSREKSARWRARHPERAQEVNRRYLERRRMRSS